MMTAGIVQGQVITAAGLLQIFQSCVDETARAWKAIPALAVSCALIESVIKKFRKEGVRSIDPLEAKEIAEGLRNISERIRLIHARADLVGATRHLPWRIFMPKLSSQGALLSQIAREVHDYEKQWQETIETAATRNLERATSLSFLDTLDVDWTMAEQQDTPETELLARHGHTAVSPRNPQE